MRDLRSLAVSGKRNNLCEWKGHDGGIGMSLIRVDYDKAIALAKELENAARMCGDSLRDLKTERGNSELCWKGVSGNAMRTQMKIAERELGAAQNQLTTIAANIRQVAEELRRTDTGLGTVIGSFFR